MPRRIPIVAAKSLAKAYRLRQVILVAWDGESTHVVTFGTTIEDCDQAALGGDLIKKAIHWPESLMGALPSRVKKLQAQVERLTSAISWALGENDYDAGDFGEDERATYEAARGAGRPHYPYWWRTKLRRLARGDA